MTRFEKRFETGLKKIGIDYEFSKIVEIFQVDFYIESLNLVIECNGPHHFKNSS